jgi:type IV pilus assembly protein PilX
VSNYNLSSRRRQSGAVLIVSLLLLLVLTVLGVVMMQTTRMQERMSGATRDLNMALQGAEAGLRYGESTILAFGSLPDTTGSMPCTVCQKGVLPVAIYDPAQFDWSANAQVYGQTGLTGTDKLKTNPRYTLAMMGFVRDNLDEGQDPPEGRDYFQVSAVSTGATGNATTVLQSTYARRF